MKRSRLLFLCLLALGCAPVEQQTDATEADHAAIMAAGNAFSAAYMAGDLDALMDLYTDDAVIFPGNSEYIRGTEDLRGYWNLPPGRTITHHKLHPVEVEISGGMASDFGHYEISGETNGEAWGPAHGKYLVVWKRGADAKWRMHLDMWNSRPSQAE